MVAHVSNTSQLLVWVMSSAGSSQAQPQCSHVVFFCTFHKEQQGQRSSFEENIKAAVSCVLSHTKLYTDEALRWYECSPRLNTPTKALILRGQRQLMAQPDVHTRWRRERDLSALRYSHNSHRKSLFSFLQDRALLQGWPLYHNNLFHLGSLCLFLFMCVF